MAHRFRLAEAGKADPAIALQPAETARIRIELGEVDTRLFGRADLEQQGFLEHQRAVAGYGLRLALGARGRGRPPA